MNRHVVRAEKQGGQEHGRLEHVAEHHGAGMPAELLEAAEHRAAERPDAADGHASRAEQQDGLHAGVVPEEGRGAGDEQEDDGAEREPLDGGGAEQLPRLGPVARHLAGEEVAAPFHEEEGHEQARVRKVDDAEVRGPEEAP